MNAPSHPHQQIQQELQNIPFFRSLSPQTLAAISEKLHFLHLDHDEIVFVEGTPADSMYLIESGQVKVSTGFGAHEKIINYLGPGNFFGEMALLLDQQRSANVTVTIDADLWVLYKADLDELLAEYPELSLHLTRELSRRLSDVVSEVTRGPGYNLVALLGDDAWRVAEAVYNTTKERVVLFDATGHNLNSRGSHNVQNDDFVIREAETGLTSDDLVEVISELVDKFDWVLIALPYAYSDVNDKAVRLAKATVLLNTLEVDWISRLSDGPVFECDVTHPWEVGRTARKLTHKVIGLALSSGGARGIAHIGVLKALEAANIPIDLIAGTSAGSLFGGLYACGKSIDEITNFAKNLVKLINLRSGLWDPKLRLPWDGLIKGNATLKYLSKQFDHTTFANTKTPFYAVATDVIAGEEVVFESGQVAEAVRASIGMIGIFAPYQLNGHYLIDGGAVNPVPATVLADKGANIIIASSVIPSIEEERARGQRSRYQNPSFLGVLSSMMSIMEREIIRTRMSPVDILIRPKVEVYTAMDYDKADEFIRLGEEAAQQELPLLQELLNT